MQAFGVSGSKVTDAGGIEQHQCRKPCPIFAYCGSRQHPHTHCQGNPERIDFTIPGLFVLIIACTDTLQDLPKDQDGYPYEPTAGLIKAPGFRERLQGSGRGRGNSRPATLASLRILRASLFLLVGFAQDRKFPHTEATMPKPHVQVPAKRTLVVQHPSEM